MPQAAADALFGRLIEAFPPGRAYTRALFEQPPMPPLVVHFLAGWLDLRLTYEIDRLPVFTSDWVDQDHTAIQQAREGLNAALRKQGQFPPSEWDPVLRQAVHQVMYHLVRPVTTAVSFIFQEERDTLPTVAIDRRMRLFKAYLYIPETAWLYFKQKDISEISRVRLTELLHRIDRHMTKDHDTETWLHLIKPLFTLYRQGVPGSKGLPAPLLQAFFEEKGVDEVAERFQLRGLEALDEATVRQVLIAEPKPPSSRPPAPSASLPPIAAEQVSSTPPGEAEALPRWKQFQQGQKRPEVEPSIPSARPAPIPDEVEAPAPLPPGAQPRWMQFRRGAEPPGAEPPGAEPAEPSVVERDVIGEAGLRNRTLFVKHLFAGSPAAYEQVLRRLYGAPTWAEASKIIAEEVFRKNQVNIYSPEAVLFTDAVEARYANRT